MRCPSCKEPDTRVVDSRDLDDGSVIRRRRACRICGTRVTTYERAELAKLYVIKRSGERQEYDSQKLLEGLRRALLGTTSPGILGTMPTNELLLILAVGTAVIWLISPRLFVAGIDRAREKGYLDRNTAS